MRKAFHAFTAIAFTTAWGAVLILVIQETAQAEPPPHRPGRGPASAFFDATAASGIQLAKAQQAYAAGDYKATAEAIASALKSESDPMVRARALELLGSTYKALDSRAIPVDWQLPHDITQLKIQVRARDNGGNDKALSYSIKVNGTESQIGAVRQVQLIRYPNQVLLDRKAGSGTWDEDIDMVGHKPYFVLRGAEVRDPVAGGLFYINLEMASGETTQGWFILEDDMSATAVPQLKSPAPGATVATLTPTFEWTPFKSPEYRSSDSRQFYLDISEITADENWKDKWTYYTDDLDASRVTLGPVPDSTGVPQLEAGKTYGLVLNYSERRFFGPLRIDRQAQTQRRFTVQK